jgi:hypothetical protein
VLNGFHSFDLDAAGTVALTLGMVVTSVDGDAHHTVVDSADGAKKGASTPLDKTPPS